MLNPNQAFLLVEKLKFAPPGFTLGVKGRNRKNIFNLPQLLVNAELSDLVLALRVKKRIPSNLGSQFATLGVNVPAFINILTSMFLHFPSNLGPSNKPKLLKVGPQVF